MFYIRVPVGGSIHVISQMIENCQEICSVCLVKIYHFCAQMIGSLLFWFCFAFSSFNPHVEADVLVIYL